MDSWVTKLSAAIKSPATTLFAGGTSSLGVKPMTNLAIKMNVEGGNFSAGSASGFNYFIVGPRVLFRF